MVVVPRLRVSEFRMLVRMLVSVCGGGGLLSTTNETSIVLLYFSPPLPVDVLLLVLSQLSPLLFLLDDGLVLLDHLGRLLDGDLGRLCVSVRGGGEVK